MDPPVRKNPDRLGLKKKKEKNSKNQSLAFILD